MLHGARPPVAAGTTAGAGDGGDDARRLQAFEAFAARQQERHAPLTPAGAAALHALPSSAGYVLRVHELSGLPVALLRPNDLQLRVSATLYSQATGEFIGATAAGAPVRHGYRDSHRLTGVAVPLGLELYLHTPLYDSSLVAALEVTACELTVDGVVAAEWAVGWAMITLFEVHGVG